jgi:hypothetical protein
LEAVNPKAPAAMNLFVSMSTSAIALDPQKFLQALRAGKTVHIPDVGYTVAPSAGEQVALHHLGADDEDGDMVSLTPDQTGVERTVFVSTKGQARHAARVKIAVDPPNSFNAASTDASMAIHDYSVTGAYLQPHIVEQTKRFIERNRDVLLQYWDAKISTGDLFKQIRKP